MLNVGYALSTAPKSYVDLDVSRQASASNRKAAVIGAVGVAMTTAENYFANVRRPAAFAASFRALGGVAAVASLQVLWAQFNEGYAAWRDNPSDANSKVSIEKFAGHSASVGGVIAAVPGGMRCHLPNLTHRRSRPSLPCSR